MVYALGSKPTLGHYAGLEPLDGDVSKIEVADKAPDGSFDANTASTYPFNQGRPVLTEHVPTKVEWQERGPVPDVETVRGFLVVPARFREIVEQFEPAVHQFLPVDFVDRQRAVLARRYFFIACNRLDSVDRALTTMILVRGHLWMPASDLVGWRPQEIPPGFDVNVEPKLVFNTAQIGGKHAWSDMFLPLTGPYLSDALGAALEAEHFTGISFGAFASDTRPAPRLMEPPDAAPFPHDAAAELLLEPLGDSRAILQVEINEAIAELRELYRIVRMFPFYRYKSRNTLADQLTGLLKTWCQSQELSDAGVDWRMKKPDFERFLRQIAEARRVPSIDEALNALHVDQLHDRWLRVAREKQFDLGSRPASLFELNLAWALKFGGPVVQDRWEHAKPYQAA